ncbi:MAG: hypothetical protein LBB77_08060 [Treponema sp.]|jgi:hypothetical protein|nr:hypothetical protein [Treponema sp.]
MDFFDVSAPWAILAPFPAIPAVEDLARCIAVLRRRDGIGKNPPAVMDALGPAPDDSVPIVVLNMGDGGSERGGYTWRAGPGRVEIYGDSLRGLCGGIYSFLASLGFSWPAPGGESLPPRPTGTGSAGPGGYPLKDRGIYVQSMPAPENRRRLVISPATPRKEIPALGRWAVRNGVDALVFSLRDKRFRGRQKVTGDRTVAELEKNWGLIIERGGWDLSPLVPRRFFFFRRELFRMEGGRRIKDHHFCPTNPQTIALIRRRMDRFLGQGTRRAAVYHFWPDRGAEDHWCACPACRAFMPREQIRLAVNALAALIEERDPQARVSCRGEEESPLEKLPGSSEITLRPNVFRLPAKLPPARPGEFSAPLYMYEDGCIRESEGR